MGERAGLRSGTPQVKVKPPIAVIASPAVQTAAGEVRLVQGDIWYYPASLGWTRMNELHRRALGREDGYVLARYKKMTPRHAARVYYRGLLCALADFMLRPPHARVGWLDRLLDFVEHRRRLGGLESPLLTALAWAAHTGDRTSLERGVALLDRLGPPKRLGAGNAFAPFVDVASSTTALLPAEAVTEAINRFKGERAAQGLGERVLGLGDAVSDGSSFCEGLLIVLGGLAGGAIGRSPAGVSAGAALGLGLGKMACGDARSSEDGTSEAPPRGSYQGVGGTGEGSADADVEGDEDGVNQSVDPMQGGTSEDDGSGDAGTGDDGGSDDGGGDEEGRPNPDDDDRPNPDGPGGRNLHSSTFLAGKGLSAWIGRAGHGFVLSNAPQLAADGGSLAERGVLSGFDSLGDLVTYTPPDAAERVDTDAIHRAGRR